MMFYESLLQNKRFKTVNISFKFLLLKIERKYQLVIDFKI